MKDRRLAFVYTPEVERLGYPADCPFNTGRAGQTRARLASFGWLGVPGRTEVTPRPARREELLALHTDAYLRELERAAAGDLTLEGLRMGLGREDTPVFRNLYEYGRWACGAALTAAELLLKQEVDVAFSLLGGFHHAMADHASGFCYLNDVALACHHLAAAGRRVLYLDVDAHHGDGVQDAFYHRADVLTVSLHESGHTLFPWGGFENEIGTGAGRGYNGNLPLPAGVYDAAYLRAVDAAVLPLLDAYAPDVIVLELGMDALAGDPLAHLSLTNHAHEQVLHRLLARDVPLLVAGGGGYHVANTVRGWALAWQVCAGDTGEDDPSLGLGGVLLGNTEWAGGLRDRQRMTPPDQQMTVDAGVAAAIETLQRNLFPCHGLPGGAPPSTAPAPPS